MSDIQPNVSIPVDLTNPGQFFACCGLLELADRLWPGAVGWFENGQFFITGHTECSLPVLFDKIANSIVANTMTAAQNNRLDSLSAMSANQRRATPGLDDEKKALESLRRELPIDLLGPISFRIDWFCDVLTGGSRLKTWAGQQSVLDITKQMRNGVVKAKLNSAETIWNYSRGIGLPFNFDSELGDQGSAIDIGFSFDPLAGSKTTRISGICRPFLEFLALIGLQRFRPLEIKGQNRYDFAAWHTPLSPVVAAACACRAIAMDKESVYEFRLLYRTKYLKSFLPAIPFHGDQND